MTILSTFGGTSGVDTGDIGHSLRFRGAQYLSRTITTDATSTYVMKVKRGKLGVISPIIETNIRFNANDTLTAFGLTTTAVFRDPTSWILIHISNNGLYVNGVSLGAVTTSAITNGRIGYDGTNYFDGYMARFCVVGGSASAYTNFDYLNTEINEWVSKSQSAVKAVVDAGGTNSFMLDFDDATSLTTLGYDKSSKGNNWTLNNFSLTAGTTYDHMLDVPGNSFSTLNPLKKNLTLITASDGNLIATNTGDASILGTMGMSSGKWYWEVTLTNNGTNGVVGISADAATLSQEVGGAGSSWGYIGATGNKYSVGSASAYGATYTTNDVIGIAYDVSTGTLTFYKNGVSQGAAFSGLSSAVTIFPAVGNSNTTYACNFGQAPLHASATYHSAAGGYFRYTPPTGFKALCQANMPDPAILNPELHFDVVTRTGTAATYSVAGLGFQPDFLWAKSRGRAVDHALYDSVRGVQKQLESNSAGAETTESTGLTSFNANGYTGGALDQINGTTATNSFVDWLWKAGGAAVTNNAGSISSQVSANVEAGFSVVTYTSPNNAADQTVGHGLTKAPGLIIAKNRISGVLNWDIYHSALASGYGLSFTTTASTAGRWPTTTPTSSVFSTKNTYEHNGTDTYVAYCFAEIPGFSKIFSYTGNGSADGPYVHCGFKPKFILVKRTDSSTYGNWEIIDTVRDTYNQSFNDLIANLSNAENVDGASWDILSNGFKCRDGSSTGNKNVSGGTYIGIAFADVAGKYSLGR